MSGDAVFRWGRKLRCYVDDETWSEGFDCTGQRVRAAYVETVSDARNSERAASVEDI